MSLEDTPVWKAFLSRKDLEKFGADSLLLFALQLKFPIEDINAIAVNSLTDGNDDKKTDMVYIDSEEGVAVIAQTYLSLDMTRPAAPSNKASDLNTAIAWLLNGPVETIPPYIRPHAEELRRSINNGEIEKIQVWYVHNLPESTNVRRELDRVEHTLKATLSQNHVAGNSIDVQALEIGSGKLNELYKAISTPILVSDKFKINIAGGFKEKGIDWEAYVTSVPAKWLFELFKRHKTALFSANIRDYLGSRKSDKNINHGIKTTAQENPRHFWVYHNGITALVNNFKEGEMNRILEIDGISIVNGAQTCGALGTMDEEPSEDTMIQARFVKCENQRTIKEIVKYNNVQNKVTAPDFRSSDLVQQRLIREFQLIPDVEYMPRRGSGEDIIMRRANALPSVTAGQALASLHKSPDIAYHEKTKIWESNTLYSDYFNEQTTAKHILFAYSINLAVQDRKLELLHKSKTGGLTEPESVEIKFYRQRGSVFMISAAIGRCLEIFLDRPIANLFSVKFKENISPSRGALIIQPLVKIAGAFTGPLNEGLSDGFRSKEKVEKSMKTFQSLVSATKGPNSGIYSELAQQIESS